MPGIDYSEVLDIAKAATPNKSRPPIENWFESFILTRAATPSSSGWFRRRTKHYMTWRNGPRTTPRTA